MGDGNCLFRAVSYQFSGTEDGHAELRARAIDQLRVSGWMGGWVGGWGGLVSEWMRRLVGRIYLESDFDEKQRQISVLNRYPRPRFVPSAICSCVCRAVLTSGMYISSLITC